MYKTQCRWRESAWFCRDIKWHFRLVFVPEIILIIVSHLIIFLDTQEDDINHPFVPGAIKLILTDGMRADVMYDISRLAHKISWTPDPFLSSPVASWSPILETAASQNERHWITALSHFLKEGALPGKSSMDWEGWEINLFCGATRIGVVCNN